MKDKIIVAHPYQQHSFMTAAAIKKMGLLEKYVTSTYDKKNSLTNLVKKFLRGDNLKRASKRKCAYLEDSEIKQICELQNLFMLLLHRLDKKKKYYNKLNNFFIKSFNYKLFKYIKKNKINNVIVYDTVCYDFIKKIRKDNMKVNIIIDMSAPSLVYMNLMFNKYIDNQLSESLLREELISYEYIQQVEKAKYEIENADYFLVASEFTSKSLEYMGIKKDKIFKCKYGIEVNNNEQLFNSQSINKKMKIVFIGNVTEKKGFHFFEKIAKELGYDKFEFHVIGKYEENDPLIFRNKDKMKFYGYVTHDEVMRLCSIMDFIIFPSLSDGYGFSVLEAMSKGVIPIVSKNAGISDLIVNNINGYKFSLENIYEAVSFCKEIFENDIQRKKIKEAVKESVENTTWDKYNDDIKYAIGRILEGKNAIY